MEIIQERGYIIKKMEVQPYQTNVYVIIDQEEPTSVIIDAANDSKRIMKEVEGTTVKYILQTHCHTDHVLALDAIRRATGAPVGINLHEPGFHRFNPELSLEDEDVIAFGNHGLKVLHTPGHTPGSLCLVLGKHLFSGDTLFPGGPGKTGSPQDFVRIIESITTKIYSLPDETIVYPGHGHTTTVGGSKKEYQIFIGKSRTRLLYGDVLWMDS